MDVKKYKSNYILFKTWFFCIAIVLLLGILENGFTESFSRAVLIWVVGSIWLFFDDYFSYFQLSKKERVLSIKKGIFSKKKKIKINEIVRIRRVQMFFIAKWGSRMEIEIATGDEINVYKIMEKPFGIKTVKEILAELSKEGPSIKLDPQYQELVEGRISEKEFLSLKATNRM